VLRQLGEERPNLAAVPRLRGEGHRAGRLAVVQDAVEGRLLLDILRPENFEELAMRVTRALVELAIDHPIGGGSQARGRDLADPYLERFEQDFGAVVEPALLDKAKASLADLGEVPQAPEHRDCSPWNILVTPAGSPVLLDWESAEPDGLAGMDLVYFLANCAFVLDGALENGRTRETYAKLLDPATPHGRIAARAIEEYTAAHGISAEDFRRLRLLCWIVHSHSDYRHLQLEAPGAPGAEALRRSTFLGLVEEELRRG
jgi:Phosphotransferase enzyme family